MYRPVKGLVRAVSYDNYDEELFYIKSGEKFIDWEYKDIKAYEDGYVVIEKTKGEEVIMDIEGNIIWTGEKTWEGTEGLFEEGLLSVRVGEYEGCIDKNGDMIIPAVFESVSVVEGGYIRVEDEKGRFGILRNPLYNESEGELKTGVVINLK